MHNKPSHKPLHLKSTCTITKILTAYKKLGIIWFWPTNQCHCNKVSHRNLLVICHIIILKCYLIHVAWTISRLSFNICHVIQPSDSQELKIDLLLHQNKLVDCNWIKMIKSNQSCSLAILSATYPPMLALVWRKYSKQTSCLPKSQSQAWGEKMSQKEIKRPHLWIFHHRIRKDVTKYLNTKLIYTCAISLRKISTDLPKRKIKAYLSKKLLSKTQWRKNFKNQNCCTTTNVYLLS